MRLFTKDKDINLKVTQIEPDLTIDRNQLAEAK